MLIKKMRIDEQFSRSSSMKLLRGSHKDSFCGDYCFTSRLVRIRRVALDEVYKQLIVDSVVKDFRKKKKEEVIPLGEI